MKLEEVNQKTKEAVDFLVAALESGQSEVLTQYLAAIAKFHTYSFGNIMLIASAVWMAIGILIMRKMINFDY